MAWLTWRHRLLHGLFQAWRAVRGLEQNRQRDRLEAGQSYVLQLGELLVGEDGGLEFDEPGVFRRGLEEVPLRANGRLGGGDNFLANAVNRADW